MSEHTTGQVAHFDLVQIRTQQPVDAVELPLDLVRQVINPDTMAINTVHGQDYTLVPREDVDVLALREVWAVFQQLGQPTRYQYVLQQRQDGLVKAVEDMFGFNEYKWIPDQAAMLDLMLFHRGQSKGHSPKIVRRPRLGAMHYRITQEPPPAEGESE